MKEHQYENEDLQRHFLETEQNSKFLLETKPKKIAEDIFLESNEIFLKKYN